MKTGKNILITFILNLLFSLIEFLSGIFTNSVAIISDSIHDLGDAISIGVAYFLEMKSLKQPDDKYSYGYVRYSLLGSLITVLILLIGSTLVIYNAILRLFNPVVINYDGMIFFAGFGILINLYAVYLTKSGTSLNQKALSLHMLEDVMGWVLVFCGAVVMRFTNLSIIDPILSIGVSIFIFIHAFKMLKDISDVFLEKTPDNIEIEKIKECLMAIKGVNDVHHIHVRSIDGFSNYATLHLVVDKYSPRIKCEAKDLLKNFEIIHTTIEFEENGEHCDCENCKIRKSIHPNYRHHHHHD